MKFIQDLNNEKVAPTMDLNENGMLGIDGVIYDLKALDFYDTQYNRIGFENGYVARKVDRNVMNELDKFFFGAKEILKSEPKYKPVPNRDGLVSIMITKDGWMKVDKKAVKVTNISYMQREGGIVRFKSGTEFQVRGTYFDAIFRNLFNPKDLNRKKTPVKIGSLRKKKPEKKAI